MKKNFVLLVLALGILAPKIRFIDFSILVFFLLNIFMRTNSGFGVHFSRRYFTIIFFWLLLIVWGLSIFSLSGSFNYVLILKPIRQIIMLSLMFSIFRRTDLEFTDVCKIIIIAALVNTIVIYLQLYGHNVLGFQGFMVPASFNIDLDVSFRKPGLFSSYPHAGLLSLIAIICLFNFMKSIKATYFVLILTCLTTSLILTSRTALVLSLLPFFIFFISAFKSKTAFVKVTFFLIIGVWIIFSFIAILPEQTFNVAFEMFLNFSKTGSFLTSSQESLNDSYMLPKNLTTLLFGNGLQNRTDIDTNIDDGYQSLLYGGGLLYLSITLILFFIYFSITFSSLKNRLHKTTIYMIYFTVLIANYKVDCMFSRVISDVLVLFLALSLNVKTVSVLNNPFKNEFQNSTN